MAADIVAFRHNPKSQRDLRDALGRFATGVAVITTCTSSGQRQGLTANSFSAVSLDPPLILWSLRSDAGSLASFVDAGHFAVNVLSLEQEALGRHFAMPQSEKFANIEHMVGHGGCPILPDCLAAFECTTEQSIGAGDHVIFIGRIVRVAHRDGDPLIFSGGTYGTFSSLGDAMGLADSRLRDGIS